MILLAHHVGQSSPMCNRPFVFFVHLCQNNARVLYCINSYPYFGCVMLIYTPEIKKIFTKKMLNTMICT